MSISVKKKRALDLFQQKDLPGARSIYQDICLTDPDDAESWEMLGAINGMLGRHQDALDACERAISLQPDRIGAHINLGNCLRLMQRFEEALVCFRNAARISPGSIDARLNSGMLLIQLARPDEALEDLNTVLQLKPDLDVPHYLAFLAWQSLGRPNEAFASINRALELQPSSPAYQDSFTKSIENLRFTRQDPGTMTRIAACLETEKFDHQAVAGAAISLLKQSPEMAPLFDLTRDMNWTAIRTGLRQKRFEAVFRNKVFLMLLRKTVMRDVEMEQLLTTLRRFCLEASANDDTTFPAWFLSRDPDFACALALQCFNNEYVYAESREESAQLEKLLAAAKNYPREQESDPTDLWKILVVTGMYRPLSGVLASYGIDASRLEPLFPALAGLVKVQVDEPAMEKRIQDEIMQLTEINDEISLRVTRQYEESPYPRWLSARLSTPRRHTEIVRALKQKFPSMRVPVAPVNVPRILIAGCGTGRHAIQTATQYAGAEVLAVDLSRASLAYATRKSRELGVQNILFRQADILELGTLKERFHVIESMGVLHHMKDPLAGWKALAHLLDADGLMRIGLYSSKAREYLRVVRNQVRARGLGDSAGDIRDARQMFIGMPADGAPDTEAKWKLRQSPDFYSLSDCRDLIFHVQETCLDLREIAAMLTQLGLTLLGFELPSAEIRKFRQFHPEPCDLADLAKWDVFENEFPDTFTAMYQFWCQKTTH